MLQPADLNDARAQWVAELHSRMQILEHARTDTRNDFDYGGAAAVCDLNNELEDAVDEARRMVCALGAEARRRSEGELPVWQDPTPNVPSNGMVRASSCQ